MNKKNKLTPHDLRRIRFWTRCGLHYNILAEHYGVSVSTISRIANRQGRYARKVVNPLLSAEV